MKARAVMTVVLDFETDNSIEQEKEFLQYEPELLLEHPQAITKIEVEECS